MKIISVPFILLVAVALPAFAQSAKLVKVFKNSATQFKVDCPQQMKVQENAAMSPPGFTTYGGTQTAVVLAVSVTAQTSHLLCEYGLPAGPLGKARYLKVGYEYSATGKQCGPSVYPCVDSRCSLVCDK
jgi:hypothetical protein